MIHDHESIHHAITNRKLYKIIVFSMPMNRDVQKFRENIRKINEAVLFLIIQRFSNNEKLI